MINILVIDDDRLIHHNFFHIFHSHSQIRIIGNGYDGKDLLSMHRRLKPDVTTIDIQMTGEGNGILAIIELLKKTPTAKVVVISNYLHTLHINVLKNLGVCAFIRKGCSLENHISAIIAAYNNKPFSCTACAKNSAIKNEGADPFNGLSQKESLVLSQLIYNKMTLKNIADTLNIGYETARTYKKRSFRKLGINTKNQLLLLAANHGFYQSNPCQ